VDPSSVLAWIFAVILAAVALFYMCSAESYNSTSLTMLITMTVVYVIVFFPCFRSWMVPAYTALPPANIEPEYYTGEQRKPTILFGEFVCVCM
jgi:hypothetical protein